ncbi:MAG: hypothetical protein JJ878_05880 [Alphaproteobacteria bacterium]|nr:hypothetical protein [Alphaproteobacteria bacterium]
MPKEREFTSTYLSDLEPGSMVRIRCDRCRRSGRYRASTLLRMLGDMPTPSALGALAEYRGCGRAKATGVDQCRLLYAAKPTLRPEVEHQQAKETAETTTKLTPRLLRVDDAAAYCSLPLRAFRDEVGRTLPRPIRLASVPLWDRYDLDTAIDALKAKRSK